MSNSSAVIAIIINSVSINSDITVLPLVITATTIAIIIATATNILVAVTVVFLLYSSQYCHCLPQLRSLSITIDKTIAIAAVGCHYCNCSSRYHCCLSSAASWLPDYDSSYSYHDHDSSSPTVHSSY